MVKSACSKPAIETLEKGVKYVQSQWRPSGVFIVNFEHISHVFLVLSRCWQYGNVGHRKIYTIGSF